MFGCLVPGRHVQTTFQQIDETHAMFQLPDAASINHICVFLTGAQLFPEGAGATLHIHSQAKGGFQLLGWLSNDKPSAIFRLRGTYTSESSAHSSLSTAMTVGSSSSSTDLMVGIALEPLSAILEQQQQSHLSTVATAPVNATDLAEKIVKNLFNYLGSFVGGGDVRTLDPSTGVPIGYVKNWYDGFMSKLRNGGTAFLDRQSD
ncbi:DUF775-domain-containing protein [Auriculariales sp. MPI-PUGE-AT-0066]|nr:DUF775-domain-containing protein [Auriculariales sp. MPI-PUGE-AT-0066]